MTLAQGGRGRRLLVTGASGFVGGHLLPRLAAAAPEADILAAGGRTTGAFTAPRLAWTRLDFTDAEAVARLAGDFRPTDVVHLAAQSSVAASFGAPTDVWRVNLLGALNLANALRAAQFAGLLIFSSSSEVYGQAFASGMALAESTPPEPASPYGRSKFAAELAIRDLAPREAATVILRLFNHSGPGQDERFVLPAFAAQVARIEAGKQDPVMKVGDLSAARDFLDVDDVIDAYLAILGAPPKPGAHLFNVASGHARPIQTYLDQLLALASRQITVAVDPERLRPSGIARADGDASAFAAAYAWRPKTSQEQMLTRVLDFWRSQVR